MKNLIWILLWVVSLPTAAYIPSYSMILSHLARTQGRGSYRIEQTITFYNNTSPLSLKEIWWITDKQQRVDVSFLHPKQKSENLHLRFIYKHPYKIFNNELGKRQKHRISPYHIDRVFHLRHNKSLQRLFYLWKVAPYKISQKESSNNNFIQLDRRHGVVQYTIAKDKTLARLWIEQDEFVIREWNWIVARDGMYGELTAWDYVLYPGRLFLPTKRKFKWKNASTVMIQVKKVQKITNNKKLFYFSTLRRKNHIPNSLVFANTIRGFYQYFR